MKVSSIILGLLVGLLSPVLVVAIMAVVVIVSLGQNVVTVVTQVARNTRKATNTHARFSRDTKVIKIPEERSSIEELRPAA